MHFIISNNLLQLNNLNRYKNNTFVHLNNMLTIVYSESYFHYQIIKNGCYLWYGENNCQPAQKDIEQILENPSSNIEIRGLLICYSEKSCELRIRNDAFGTIPIYYYSTDNEFIISNRLGFFAQRGHALDMVSVMQFMKYAFTIGKYSLLKNVYRLTAKSEIIAEKSESSYRISTRSLNTLWPQPNGKHLDKKIDTIIDIIKEEYSTCPDVQLMASAGWDSRLLMASLLSSKIPFSAFCHGDIHSREIKIVRKICERFHIPLTLRELDTMELNISSLQKQLDRCESALFPYWADGINLAQQNMKIVTAGIFGELVGGHFSTLNSMSGFRKYAVLFKFLLTGKSGKEHEKPEDSLAVIFKLLSERSLYSSWIFTDKENQLFGNADIINESNRRLYETLEGYVNDGISCSMALNERYRSEHIGARWLAPQPHNHMPLTGFRSLYTNEKFISAVNEIPFGLRIHNKFTRKLIQKLAPSLLQYPTSATVVSSSFPILIQEFSRLLRKLYETCSYGKRSPHLGWNNFGFLNETNLFSDIVSHLSGTTWSSSAKRGSNSLECYLLLEMYCKALTVNYLMQRGAGSIKEQID